MTLLWSNPDEDSGSNLSAFGAQTISLDLSEYRAIEIQFCNYVRLKAFCERAYVTDTITKHIASFTFGDNISSWYLVSQFREYTVSQSGITFEEGYLSQISQAPTLENLYVIPLKIYGIK